MDKTTNKKIDVLDTTLRDGAQCEGVAFSLTDKLLITEYLDDFGVSFIEASAFDKRDLEYFNKARELKLKTSKICAFGSTRRKDTICEKDASILNLLNTEASVITLFGKSWDFHVKEILQTTLEENLNMIKESVKFFKSKNKYVIYDAEHFFDGYLNNKLYALKTLESANSGGADVICLCDTNGGTGPLTIAAIVKEICGLYKDKTIGIHCHNDSGFGVINTIFAVENGATHIQGTFNGIGERCGNANLSSIIPYLQLKKGYELAEKSKLELLRETAVNISDVTNITLSPLEPYVGSGAFTHKAGMHADGVLKATSSFEHIEPGLVGNERRFLVSEISGKKIIAKKVNKFYPKLNADSKEIEIILEKLKELSAQGYEFESAEASFALAVKRLLKDYVPTFTLVSFKTIIEQPAVEGVAASAIIKIRVGNKKEIASAEGEGPVDALDKALRNALTKFYPQLNKVILTDYKVRVLDPQKATGARVRVLITSTDGKTTWTTVGVSADLIQASFEALRDSIEYKLLNLTA